MARTPPGPDARRRDLALDRMVAESVSLGPDPAPVDELTAAVQRARDADGAPDWLRGIGRDRIADEFDAVAAEYGPLLHSTHGADIAARLLGGAARELPEPGGATLFGCFAADDGEVALAGLTVRRDGRSLTVDDAVEEHPLIVAGAGAQATAVERAAAGKLVALAARHRLRPITPAASVVVGLAAAPDPAGLLPAAALVAGVGATALALPDSSDTRAVNAFKVAALTSAPAALVVWDPGTGRLGWLWKWAADKKQRIVVVHGADAGEAADETFAALLPVARAAKADAEAESDGFETVTVTLDKVGSRGAAQGDDLQVTSRTCHHKKMKRLRGGAEAKMKGAKNVAGLPEGSTLRSLSMCADMGCTLSWATYRIPSGFGWPPSSG